MEKRYKQEMERRRGVTADFKVILSNKTFKISELYITIDDQVRYLVLNIKVGTIDTSIKLMNIYFTKLISLKLPLPEKYLYNI